MPLCSRLCVSVGLTSELSVPHQLPLQTPAAITDPRERHGQRHGVGNNEGRSPCTGNEKKMRVGKRGNTLERTGRTHSREPAVLYITKCAEHPGKETATSCSTAVIRLGGGGPGSPSAERRAPLERAALKKKEKPGERDFQFVVRELTIFSIVLPSKSRNNGKEKIGAEKALVRGQGKKEEVQTRVRRLCFENTET